MYAHACMEVHCTGMSNSPAGSGLTHEQNSETRMTASTVKQDPNTYKLPKNTIYQDKTQHANFQGNPLYQATKWYVNNN